MSHEISNTDGVYTFADSRVGADGRVDAWHRLGTPVGHAMTAEEALKSAHLANWNVRKRPVWADIREDGGECRGLVVPGQYATVFDNPINGKVTPIGVVGERYTPIQNESMTDFSNALVDESGSHFETAGSLRNFSQTFITMKLPKHMVLTDLDGRTDQTDWYLALFNSHDGSSSMFAITTTVRVVCANTASFAISGAKNKFSVRHTSGYRNSVQEARETLKLAFAYEEAFEAEARALFEQPFTSDNMSVFAQELVELGKAEPGSATETRRRNEAGAIHKLFVESPTIKGTAIAGTKYAAFNAVTEYVDHFQTVKGGRGNAEVESGLRAARTLAMASTSGGMKSEAWSLLVNS